MALLAPLRPPSAADLLEAWERGLPQAPLERALSLLAAACPDRPPAELAELSVGLRDAGLLTLREWAFGPTLLSVAVCPACGERLELSFAVADIRVPNALAADGAVTAKVAGYVVRVRPPNSRDLARLRPSDGIEANRRRLLEPCVLSAHRRGRVQAPSDLPAAVVDAIAARLADADPQADVRLNLNCPACGHGWLAAFDIAGFLWSEVNAWAIRLLRDVHTLAAAYGWPEADILSLSPARRSLYLAMVGA